MTLKENTGATLPFKHDTKRVRWLLDSNVNLFFSNLIRVATKEKELECVKWLDIQKAMSPERWIT